jgi:oligopeptide/dipeptide ABC transporter ATP-binding protein
MAGRCGAYERTSSTLVEVTLSLPEHMNLLSVEHVAVRLHGARRATKQILGNLILNDVNLEVRSGEIVGLIGETGSWKTTLARTIVGLVRTTSGVIRFEGDEISKLSRRATRAFRRRGAVQFVFQDPLRSLDPDMTIGQIVGEGLAVQNELDPSARRVAVREALEVVGLDPGISERRPGQISGGQRQRASIARAVVMRPKLLICDEPVSALDASTRNLVLRILIDLRKEFELALLIISHDLASLAGVADRVAVLYQGRVVEEGPLDAIFSAARHPYSALLVATSPSLARSRAETIDITRFDHDESDTQQVTTGCAFAPRCPYASDACRAITPERVEIAPRWSVACHHADQWREVVLADPPLTSVAGER